ncbi:hypothetical protein [Bdellovibrio sp. HCB337]|uniref:hypothetical protein n=1 Tax=Bdellovibrio sp. HCB337 TaxID=3394358 RepID=UPI0039A668DA
MMNLLITLLLTGSFAATAPIQSKEEIQFESKADNKLLDIFKSGSYLGIIGRPQEPNVDLKMVDLYAFKDTKQISMSEDLCKDLLAKIYGPLDKGTLKVTKINIFTSHTGKTCEAQIDDPIKTSKIPERRAIIGFIKAKPYGLEFQLSKKSDTDIQDNTRKFWESLR